jgi:two-component system chemotaxis sensor kinase CheA
VVRSNVENLKGSIQIESTPGVGCTFIIRLPLTLATTRVLLVEVAGRTYAVPLEFVEAMVAVSPAQFFRIEGREHLVWQNQAISIARLAAVLELAEPAADADKNGGPNGAAPATLVCVVLAVGADKIGLLVDGLLDEQEVVLKPLGPLLKRVRNVSGATILGAGEVCMVLNPHDLVLSAQRSRPVALAPERPLQEAAARKLILLAEDSITTRTQEKRILESAGYEVITAVDGADALQKLPLHPFDGLVSDVEMPNLDGLSLCARIRENPKYQELPIVLVTSLASDDDKRRGIEVGANAYITKGTFEQKVLVDTVRRLV